MAKTTTDLYRRGNASGPRLAHVRLGKDLVTFQKGRDEWVAAHSGGVSTFSKQGPGRNWWRLPAESDFPDDLYVVNDHGNHYNWEPGIDMPLSDFLAKLASVEPGFRKVS
jgi:hypothetical protein